MRSYIFTSKERQVIQEFLRAQASDKALLRQLRYRVKHFESLASDVQLYLRLREAMSTRSV